MRFPSTKCTFVTLPFYYLNGRGRRPMSWLEKEYPINKIWIVFLALYWKLYKLCSTFASFCPYIKIAILIARGNRIVGFYNFPIFRLIYNVLALPFKKRAVYVQCVNSVFIVSHCWWCVWSLYHFSTLLLIFLRIRDFFYEIIERYLEGFGNFVERINSRMIVGVV